MSLVILGLRIDTLITRFQHMFKHRKQSRQGIEQFRESIHIVTKLWSPRTKSVTGSHPPRRQSKQGEHELSFVTKAGRNSN